MLTALGILFVTIFSVVYLVDFLKDPDWGIRAALEIGVIAVGIVLVIFIVWDSSKFSRKEPGNSALTTGEAEFDDPANISPAERVRRLQEKSMTRSDDDSQ